MTTHDPRRPRPPPSVPRRRGRPARSAAPRPGFVRPARRPADPRRRLRRSPSLVAVRQGGEPGRRRRHRAHPHRVGPASNSPCTSTASPSSSPSWSASSRSCVQIYSTGYLRDDPRYPSYAALVSLFTSAMLLVVYSGDLMVLLVGWEIMGICSYFLVGHYWETARGPRRLPQGLPGHQARRRPLPDRPVRARRRRRHVPHHRRSSAPSPSGGLDHPTLIALLLLAGVAGKSRAVPAAHLAARRDGGPHPRLRADPRRDDGRRRHLLRRPAPPGLRRLPAALVVLAVMAAVTHGRLGARRARPGRHQARPRLLDDRPARLHDRRPRRRRPRRRRLPPPRRTAPSRRCCSSRAGVIIHAAGTNSLAAMSRMGGLRHARPRRLLDDDRRAARARRDPALQRLLLQGGRPRRRRARRHRRPSAPPAPRAGSSSSPACSRPCSPPRTRPACGCWPSAAGAPRPPTTAGSRSP